MDIGCEEFTGSVAVELLRSAFVQKRVDVSKRRRTVQRPKPLSQPLPERHSTNPSLSPSRLGDAF